MYKAQVFLLTSLALLLTSSVRIFAQSGPAQGQAGDSTKYTIENCITKFSPGKAEKTDAGSQFWFADPLFAGGKTVKMSIVRPHSATHAPHHHLEDEFFFVLEGKAEFYLKGKWTPAGPNTCLYCPSNVEHGIRNAGDTELRYLVIKKYDKDNPVMIDFEKKEREEKR